MVAGQLADDTTEHRVCLFLGGGKGADPESLGELVQPCWVDGGQLGEDDHHACDTG